MNRLSQGPASHKGKKHVLQLLDHFHHEGPNGVHLYLVLELLGPCIFSIAESYSSNRLPGDIAWEASKQIVHGLTYIHALGIVHGGQLNICMLALIPTECYSSQICIRATFSLRTQRNMIYPIRTSSRLLESRELLMSCPQMGLLCIHMFPNTSFARHLYQPQHERSDLLW